MHPALAICLLGPSRLGERFCPAPLDMGPIGGNAPVVHRAGGGRPDYRILPSGLNVESNHPHPPSSALSLRPIPSPPREGAPLDMGFIGQNPEARGQRPELGGGVSHAFRHPRLGLPLDMGSIGWNAPADDRAGGGSPDYRILPLSIECRVTPPPPPFPGPVLRPLDMGSIRSRPADRCRASAIRP
jgi:hypothetical protein